MSKPTWYTVCANDKRELHMGRLDPDGPLLALCDKCDETKPARQRSAPAEQYQRGYVGNERSPASFARARSSSPVHTRLTGCIVSRKTVQAGMKLERAPILKGGIGRDRDEARADFAGQPWAALVRHVASDPVWHVYERPDPDWADLRSAEQSGLEAIEQWRVEP